MSKGKGKSSRKRLSEPPPQPPTPTAPPSSRPIVSERHRSALVELVGAIRVALGALLDLADATADVIAKKINERRS